MAAQRIVSTIGLAAWLTVVHVAAAAPLVFDRPTDDRWQYPFNFVPGTRDVAPLFGSVEDRSFDTFNDRDGIFIVAWDTTTLVTPGLPLAGYDIQSITITLTHEEFADWPIDLTTDDHRTFDANKNGIMDNGELPDSDPGRPIELFGVGFGPVHSYLGWNEFSSYIGGSQTVAHARDPFPFVYQEVTGTMLHVENSVTGKFNKGLAVPLCGDPNEICPFTPTSWAIGSPINYTPGNQPIPFDVTFEVDLTLSNGRVRQYFQQQLQGGRFIVAFSSLKAATEQVAGNHDFFTKEATEPDIFGNPPIPGAKAPNLVIVMSAPATGDFNNDNIVNLDDHAAFADCLSGPGELPMTNVGPCLDAFDFDRDDDVDLNDAEMFWIRFGGGT